MRVTGPPVHLFGSDRCGIPAHLHLVESFGLFFPLFLSLYLLTLVCVSAVDLVFVLQIVDDPLQFFTTIFILAEDPPQ